MQRQVDAVAQFNQVLKIDANNKAAMTSLGFLAREQNNDKAAQEYFSRLIQLYPDDHVAYLAMGDLYTSQHDPMKALVQYEQANKLAPKNALVVSRAVNASIDSHDLKLAKNWLDRSDDVIKFQLTKSTGLAKTIA